MAEFGANLSSVNQDEDHLPSIFEILAQESLVSTIRPALNHVFRVAASNYPENLNWLYRYSDEVYLGFHLLLENYFLRRYCASFSENFYGLKRVLTNYTEKKRNDTNGSTSNNNGNPSNHLPASEHLRSLLFLVLVPYMKNKFDQFYEKLLENPDSLQRMQGLKGKLCRAFFAVYPVLHSAWEGSMLVFQLAYVFGKYQHHSPFLRFAGVVLRHLSLSDLKMQAGSSTSIPLADVLKGKRWWQMVLILVLKSFGYVSVFLSGGLSLGIFFLQFLDWWYSSDQRAVSLTALPSPDCPKVNHSTNLPTLNSICPICRKLRTNDTALSVSGYVFCYPCIFQFVKDRSCCPITGYPAKLDHLVRIYASEDN